jgi:hypothetical protein
MARLRDRPTGDLMVLMIAFTICGYVAVSAATGLFLAVTTNRDLSTLARNIADIINTLIGLLAGFIAGRTEIAFKSKSKNEDDTGSSGA